MTNSLRTGALVVAAALAGGVTAYAVDSTHSDTRTIIRTASPAATTVSAAPQQGLSVNQIYRKDAPGVVVVTATTTTTTSNQFDPFGAPQHQQAQALGSGFVIDKSGQILSDDPNNPQSGSIGIGFAVPMNTVKSVADQIIASGKAQHTYLGILGSEITPNLAQALNLGVDHGVLIGKVESGSPAAKAGLKAGTTQATIQGQTMTLGGDVITSIDGKQIRTFDD